MNTTTTLDIDVSSHVKIWAEKKLSEDREYIEQRAQFAPEPVRSIARLVLAVGEGVQL